MDGWEWDVTLFGGTARYYEQGRLPYAPGLADAIDALRPGRVGAGRLLDVGCGPGTLTFRLADRFERVVGLDPDPGMITEARRVAVRDGVTNAAFVEARAEDLPLGLGMFEVVVFGQSFHWMDRERVATTVHGMLPPGGMLLHVTDRKDMPTPDRTGVTDPAPPYERISELVTAYLGPHRRAGRGVLPGGTPSGEAEILAGAGFDGPERVVVPAGAVLTRSPDDVIAWVHSRSNSAPGLFGDDLAAFDAQLRGLLAETAPGGRFAEHQPDTEMHVWRQRATQ